MRSRRAATILPPVALHPVQEAGVKQSHWADTTVPPHQGPSARVSHAGSTGAEHHAHREAMMADKPTQAEISAFLDGLRAYRGTIPERQREMLDVMVLGAIRQRSEAEKEEVQGYWAAVNPVGPAGGLGAGAVVW